MPTLDAFLLTTMPVYGVFAVAMAICRYCFVYARSDYGYILFFYMRDGEALSNR